MNAEHIRETVALVGLIGLGLTFAAYVAMKLYPHLLDAWERIGYRKARVAFLVFAAGAVMYGGSKNVTGTISFPQTDPDEWYLRNSGSSVSNDYITVGFTRNLVLPLTASIFIDACDVRHTNSSAWVEHSFNVYSNTLDSVTNPFVVAYPAATNFNWMVYTDYVKPPVTHTNGVAYVAWMIGADKATNDLAMTRTGVYLNAKRVAPNPAITNGPPVSVSLTTSGGSDE